MQELNECDNKPLFIVDNTPVVIVDSCPAELFSIDDCQANYEPDNDGARRYGNNRYHKPASLKRKRAKIAAISRRRNRK